MQVALRTQQVLAYETGVPNVLDPLGGSYYVEALTDQLEAEAEALFAEIEGIGGVVRGLEDGWFQRKIAESAARQQWEIEQHRRVIVGVNEFVTDEERSTIPLLRIGEQVDREQRERLARVRAERDQALCDERLDAAARGRARDRERLPAHPRLRARLLHALRDPPRARGRVRRLPRAGLLLSLADASRTAEWWESYFDAHYLLEYEPIFDLARDRREVAPSDRGPRAADRLARARRAVRAGTPRAPARRGRASDVDGLDYSAHLIAKAKQRGTGPTLHYTRGDMRTPAGALDRRGSTPSSTSSRRSASSPIRTDDARVIAEFARVLKPGGMLVWHGGSRDGVMARFLSRDWWKAHDGTMIGHERRSIPLSGVLTIDTDVGGAVRSRDAASTASGSTPRRAWPSSALDAGLVVEEAYDGWRDRPLRRRSSEMLLVARKRQLPRRRRGG